MKSECRRVAMARPKSRLAEIPASQTQIHFWPNVVTRSCNEQPRRQFNVSRFLHRRYTSLSSWTIRRNISLADPVLVFLLVKSLRKRTCSLTDREEILTNLLGMVQCPNIVQISQVLHILCNSIFCCL